MDEDVDGIVVVDVVPSSAGGGVGVGARVLAVCERRRQQIMHHRNVVLRGDLMGSDNKKSRQKEKRESKSR